MPNFATSVLKPGDRAGYTAGQSLPKILVALTDSCGVLNTTDISTIIVASSLLRTGSEGWHCYL